MVVGGGFEPPKALPTDLQSVPFGRSGTPPFDFRNNGYEANADPNPRSEINNSGASGGTRTPDPLITNQ